MNELAFKLVISHSYEWMDGCVYVFLAWYSASITHFDVVALPCVESVLALPRSPSPEPIYNNEGKRLNTREYRTRKKLEDDRHGAITRMFELNTDYKPPSDYK